MTSPTPQTTPTAPTMTDPIEPTMAGIDASRLGMLLDVSLDVAVEIGRCRMSLQEILALGEGSTLTLDAAPDEPLTVLVNGQAVARGEAVVVDDRLAVRITDIVSPRERAARAR